MNPPAATAASYDASTNILTVTFTEIVDPRTIDLIKMALDDDAGGSNMELQFSKDNVELITTRDDAVMEFAFIPKHQQKLELMDTSNLTLLMLQYAIQDKDRNTNKEIGVADALPVTFVPEPAIEKTVIDSANYDAGTNRLTIFLNEVPISTFRWYGETLNAINFEAISIHDVGGDVPVTATLSGKRNVSVKGNNLEIEVLPADQRLIETLVHRDALKLTVGAFAILDKQNNGIREFTLDGNISISYTPISVDFTPSIESIRYVSFQSSFVLTEDALTHLEYAGVEAAVLDILDGDRDLMDVTYLDKTEYLDLLKQKIGEDKLAKYQGIILKHTANHNQLIFAFGNIDARTRGIDTTNVVLTGIKFITADSVHTLAGGVVSGFKSGKPAFIRNILIDVTAQDETFIKLNAGKNITVTIDDLSFFFEKTLNGNFKKEQIPLEFVGDPVPPSVTRLKYDFTNNTLNLDFDKIVRLDKFMPTGITIAGVKLTGGTVEEPTHSTHFTIKLNQADSTAINSLDIEKKKDLQIEVSANTLVNLEGQANSALNFKNFDVTAELDTIVVGYGRGFWDRSFEAFPTPDNLVSSALRAVGNHCYIYVADDQWGTAVTDSAVQHFLALFEKSCPADPNKGIYQICREAYGEETDTDGDPKIILFLTDLRDQYDIGGNARTATWPKAGFFDPRNELPVSQYAHSNEADMIYIDAFPIVAAGLVGNVLADQFTRMILYHQDQDEQQWLVEGIAAMSQMLCGFDFQSYEVDNNRLPAMKLKGSSENVLPLWTGWQAGMLTDWLDLYSTFLFHLYLYEQYGGFDIIKMIARDNENQGLASIDTALAKWASQNSKPAVTVAGIYPDFALACFMDNLVSADYTGKYYYQAVDLGYADLRLLDWKRDNYWRSSFNWTFTFFKVKQENIPDAIKFNGTDGAIFNLTAATMTDNPQTKTAQLDPTTNLGTLDLSDMKNSDIVLCVSNLTPGSVIGYNLILSKDNTPPEYVKLNIFQNPSADKVLDIYVVTNERLYLDVPTDEPQTSTLGEGPLIKMTVNNTTTSEVAQRSFTSTSESMFLYHLEQTLIGGGGEYTFEASGFDVAGNAFSPSQANLTVRKLIANQGGTIESTDHTATLHITSGGLNQDQPIIAFIDETAATGAIYRFGSEQIRLKKPASLSIQYKAPLNGDEIAVYQRINDAWTSIGGRVNLTTHTISVEVNQLGDFMVASGQPESVVTEAPVPDRYQLAQNYPNPFNPTTTIQYALPKDGFVKLTVYNLLGEEVATLIEKSQKAGYHRIVWDATGLSSGLYLYKIKSGDFSMIRKMTVIK